MKLEKHFLNADFIQADESYITDGLILIQKKYCNSSIIEKLKTMDDIFEKCKNTVPFEKGKKFEIISGTKCELYKNERIGIIYNERYLFNYDFVKIMMHTLPYYDKETYVVENKRNEPILKFFIGDEFVGLIMPIDKEFGES